MSQLKLSQFIKQHLLEAVAKLARLYPGSMVDYDGTKWEAIKEMHNAAGELGFKWKWIGGKPVTSLKDFGELIRPPKGDDSVYSFFPYERDGIEHPIYQAERFNHEVLTGRPVARDNRSVSEVVMPPEVVDAKTAFQYARSHPGWRDGEHYIAQDPVTAAKYAILVLKKRFYKAENTIKRDKLAWDNYLIHFPDAA
jgi:hypothetical protein